MPFLEEKVEEKRDEVTKLELENNRLEALNENLADEVNKLTEELRKYEEWQDK